ncbi:hypothetical protein [Breznakiella homolactica]|uniref:Uncharacterized protein n=1 Tax=Breznakiella homolactica TaxID=2798577 RepID=A0A7T7XQN1_9SPIR|nr:hypothetical protein [Breznakiella homolactica]QQO10709.1 hypothetical protein JFL75_07290 [Breznakiella homolactica]
MKKYIIYIIFFIMSSELFSDEKIIQIYEQKKETMSLIQLEDIIKTYNEIRTRGIDLTGYEVVIEEDEENLYITYYKKDSKYRGRGFAPGEPEVLYIIDLKTREIKNISYRG